jgi:MFS family permease
MPGARRQVIFTSLGMPNYRMFAVAQFFSSTGIWVQRVAQDWLVLTLTGSATAVGVTTALQFSPMLLFGLVGGTMADRHAKRRLLLATQLLMALTAIALAVLAFSHQLQVWHVYAIAFALGTVFAFDIPARQAYVNELVKPGQLRNAISLNAAAFQLGALAGPALAGPLLTVAGPGSAFVITAASYAIPTVAVARIRESRLYRVTPAGARSRRQLREGLRYVAQRPVLLWMTVLCGVFGMFASNLPVTNAAYARFVFHTGATGYGMLSALVAGGSLLGALLSAARAQPTLRFNVLTAAALALLYVIASAVPGLPAFAVLAVAIGAATMTLVTAVNTTVQLGAEEHVRGRVTGLYMLVFVGGGALGGPLIGAIDQGVGPQFGMLTAGLVPGAVTALVAARLFIAAARKTKAAPAPLAGSQEIEVTWDEQHRQRL